MQEKSFTIVGHQGREIPCDLITPSPTATKLALMMPGGGYNVDRPLLYFTTDALLQRNYQVLHVHTNYSRFKAYQELVSRKDKDGVSELMKQESCAITDELAKLGISPSIIIGKSAGTFAMTELVPRFKSTANIWLTPWLRDRWAMIESISKNNLIVIGDADPYYTEAMPHLPKHAKIIPGADHSLEIAGHIPESINVLGRVTKMICDHIDQFS